MVNLRAGAGLVRDLLSGDTARSGPPAVTVYVTRRCNLKCPWCHYRSDDFLAETGVAGAPAQDMSLAQFSDICRQVSAVGTRTLVINGQGEPTLHADLLDMIAEAGRRGLRTVLFTNGTRLDERLVRGLVDSGLDHLRVSLWSASREGYARNYAGAKPNNFDRIVAGIKALRALRDQKKRRKPMVSMYSPICRTNVSEIEDFARLARDCGVDRLTFAPFDANELADNPLELSPAERADVERRLFQLRRNMGATGVDLRFGDVLAHYHQGAKVLCEIPCFAGWLHAAVGLDGRVSACHDCETALGDINEEDFADIWNGAAFRDFRRRMLGDGVTAARQYGCDCGCCCHLSLNARVHRVFRWLAPLRRS